MAELEKVFAATHRVERDTKAKILEMQRLDTLLDGKLGSRFRATLEHQKALLLCAVEAGEASIATKCAYVVRRVHEAAEDLPRAPLLKMLREKRLAAERAAELAGSSVADSDHSPVSSMARAVPRSPQRRS
eukprot:TRINITY_DN11987_c0_g1_i3.p1 TRINITY_DN11987_c0_g1~~TRINITY_DN11987_c0_g1_i3.p1  ORF type:complete len:131 (+),score=46.44 TRINITY_DN11987_c0_g1_i3:277-669(+)